MIRAARRSRAGVSRAETAALFLFLCFFEAINISINAGFRHGLPADSKREYPRKVAACVLIGALASIACLIPERDGFRDRLLRALVVFAGVLFGITEWLSLFAALRRGPLLVSWLAVIGLAFAGALGRSTGIRFQIRLPSRDPIVLVCASGIGAILALTGVTAAVSAPNTTDAMAYHLPRVVYWAEQASVRFFPTPYLNQIMLQPFAEYVMLHSYLLSGGDRLVNLVQWFASLFSILGVSSVARMLGAGPRAQAIAALFAATLPTGVLAASGAKNDYCLALWLVAAVYFAVRFARTELPSDALAMGGALGLALLTKATAYLFAPWLLAAVLVACPAGPRRRLVPGVLAALACALLMNAPHYVRNLELSGSPLGFDSAQGDGFFRWRNDRFGWKPTVSNILRNLSDQLGGRSNQSNHNVYTWVVWAHQRVGIDVNDPATTWPWTVFEPPRNANHEANANSRWHLLILTIAGCVLTWRAARGRERPAAFYAWALLLAFVAFSSYLKWQLYLARLFLPLFVAAAPIAGVLADSGLRVFPPKPRAVLQAALCLFLLSVARLPALENWVRPLRGERNVFRVARDDQYFADMTAWNNRGAYEQTVDELARGPCRTIGIDSTNLSLEYPLMALLGERRPGARFLHTGVANASRQFPQPVARIPCAVVCLDCAGDLKRQQLYGEFPNRVAIDRFLIFHKP